MSDLYDRQKTLDLKIPHQATIVGCGGVGSWVALNFSLVGVRKLILVDPDTVEESNLNRTPFRLSDVGKSKVQAISELIFERRSDCQVFAYQKRLEDLDNYQIAMIKQSDAIIDCRDTTANMISQTTAKLGYDGFNVTIHLNPQSERVWGEQQTTYTTVPSFLVPPQFLAALVTLYVVTKNSDSKEVIKTFDIREVLKWLM